MTTHALTRPLSTPLEVASAEPISLLQLDGRDPIDMASTIYRQVRQGRRVVAVVAGAGEALHALADRLEAIGVGVARPDRGEVAFDADVALVHGRDDSPPAKISAVEHPRRVAVAGLGVIGGGVLQRLSADPGYVVVGALVKNPNRPRDSDVADVPLFTDPAALLAREPDVIVDALSDASTALAFIRAALCRGVDVVSAGKQAICGDLVGLTELAKASGARLAYSACVGGGAPLVEATRRACGLGQIVKIEGVLNGTSNYVLNRLAEGRDLDRALSDARDAGFAEADASADLSGLDAAAKLVILAHEAGHALTMASVRRDPFTLPPASRTVRQVASFDLSSSTAQVAFERLEPDHPLAHLKDERNAVRITLQDGRVVCADGRGAGRIPTVESVLADLVELGSRQR